MLKDLSTSKRVNSNEEKPTKSILDQKLHKKKSNLLRRTINKQSSKKKLYTNISDESRLMLLEAVIIQGEKIKYAAKRLKINYSSAKSICQIFKREGRSKKKLNKKKSARNEELSDAKRYLNNLTKDEMTFSLLMDINLMKMKEETLKKPDKLELIKYACLAKVKEMNKILLEQNLLQSSRKILPVNNQNYNIPQSCEKISLAQLSPPQFANYDSVGNTDLRLNSDNKNNNIVNSNESNVQIENGKLEKGIIGNLNGCIVPDPTSLFLTPAAGTINYEDNKFQSQDQFKNSLVPREWQASMLLNPNTMKAFGVLTNHLANNQQQQHYSNLSGYGNLKFMENNQVCNNSTLELPKSLGRPICSTNNITYNNNNNLQLDCISNSKSQDLLNYFGKNSNYDISTAINGGAGCYGNSNNANFCGLNTNPFGALEQIIQSTNLKNNLKTCLDKSISNFMGNFNMDNLSNTIFPTIQQQQKLPIMNSNAFIYPNQIPSLSQSSPFSPITYSNNQLNYQTLQFGIGSNGSNFIQPNTSPILQCNSPIIQPNSPIQSNPSQSTPGLMLTQPQNFLEFSNLFSHSQNISILSNLKDKAKFYSYPAQQ